MQWMIFSSKLGRCETIQIHKHTHSSHTHSLTQSHNRHDLQKSGAVETKMAEWHTRTASPLIRERPAQRLLLRLGLGLMPLTTARGASIHTTQPYNTPTTLLLRKLLSFTWKHTHRGLSAGRFPHFPFFYHRAHGCISLLFLLLPPPPPLSFAFHILSAFYILYYDGKRSVKQISRILVSSHPHPPPPPPPPPQ